MTDRPDPSAFKEGEEAPPRGVRTMALVRWGILAAVASLAFVTVYGAAAQRATEEHVPHARARYHCPMHPQITSDVPGECPICHMTLVLIPDEPSPSPSSAPSGDRPRSLPAPRDARPSVTGSGTAAALPPPPDTSPVTLTFDRAQAIGVRTALVERTTSAEPLRVAAAVEAPALSAAEVHVRTPGFVETMAFREIGARVRAGQTLATVYSAEVYQAEQELLAVLDWKDRGPGPAPLEAAKRRLELLSVPRAMIDRIAETREPVRAIAVTAPIDGFVVKKTAVLGAYVTPETSLFDIVGLDRVYVVASVEPSALGFVKVGASARFFTPSLPGRFFDATVDLVYPTIDPVARSARVRFSLKNADLSLRPGQVGTAEFAASARDALVVPLDAVVQTGRAAYVFVVEGSTYSARSVLVGGAGGGSERSGGRERSDDHEDRVVVHGDLRAGDRVVSRATFLVDSDSRIRASLARSGPAPEAMGPASGTP